MSKDKCCDTCIYCDYIPQFKVNSCALQSHNGAPSWYIDKPQNCAFSSFSLFIEEDNGSHCTEWYDGVTA